MFEIRLLVLYEHIYETISFMNKLNLLESSFIPCDSQKSKCFGITVALSEILLLFAPSLIIRGCTRRVGQLTMLRRMKLKHINDLSLGMHIQNIHIDLHFMFQ